MRHQLVFLGAHGADGLVVFGDTLDAGHVGAELVGVVAAAQDEVLEVVDAVAQGDGAAVGGVALGQRVFLGDAPLLVHRRRLMDGDPSQGHRKQCQQEKGQAEAGANFHIGQHAYLPSVCFLSATEDLPLINPYEQY